MSEKVEFEGAVCIAQTKQAICVRLADRDEMVWIPQSQVDDDSEVYQAGDKGTLVVSEWIAMQKGLI